MTSSAVRSHSEGKTGAGGRQRRRSANAEPDPELQQEEVM
jgi:hypothetical protein